MKVIVWKFKGITVAVFRVPRIEGPLQLQFPASFEKNTATESNCPLRFQEHCTSTVTAMNRSRVLNVVISKGIVFYVYFGVLLLAHHQCNFQGAFLKKEAWTETLSQQ